MAHWSENSFPLKQRHIVIQRREDLERLARGFTDVCVVILPPCAESGDYRKPLEKVGEQVADIAKTLGSEATLVTVGEVIDLVQVQAHAPAAVRYQNWIAIQRAQSDVLDQCFLPHSHFGALIHTRYMASLRHTKTRVQYTYCPSCDKTTKDYGGKKHTYHEYGTLLSDVWRDISCELGGDLTPIMTRFADLFGLEPYQEMLVLDCRTLDLRREPFGYTTGFDRDGAFQFVREPAPPYAEATQMGLLSMLPDNPSSTEQPAISESQLPVALTNQILEEDCLEQLATIPDNTIDFIFTDPPYNLGKGYSGYSDDLEIRQYFEWCDKWIAELVRVLKPGCTCTILNIPIWSIRHFLFMNTLLQFQNWIVWDALAFPARFIMPAHYTILAFSKGPSRPLPGLVGEAGLTDIYNGLSPFKSLEPLSDGYCLRARCVANRQKARTNDRGPLTDMWGDIFRLKHNSRRVDHPTQLPPQLLYRLIAIYTRPDEVVLDCFNGAGTTTLAAHQLGRRYIGIEKSPKYCEMARARHAEIRVGVDPFRKAERELTAKNSPVPRLPKQKYEVPKKTLQLEVKRVAALLGHMPTRAELIQYGRYSIRYYDEYFVSWGEVCAAARTTGMTESRALPTTPRSIEDLQLRLGI
jgi:site-specific DNA-methyltransferase (adenine-specific)